MASSPVTELEAGLQAMLGLKPPGVSGSRITALTALCVNNVQSESVLVQKLYTHFKKAPGTHKLGVLYVVDSVTRKWLDQAKQNGQTVNGSAPDGTYAAGVNRVTELIPVLMNDILSTAPADQKDKIKKLVDIWEKGQTFPAPLIESFKEKFNAPPPNTSTTPPGSPPTNAPNANANANANGARFGAPPAAPSVLPPNIMETLANLAKQSSAPAASATPPTVSAPFGQPQQSYSAQPPVSAPYSAPAPYQMAPAQQPPFSLPFGQANTAAPALAPTPAPAANSQLPPALAGLAGLISAASQQQPPPIQPIQPVQPVQQQQAAPNLQQNLMLIQALLAQGLPIESITSILSSFGSAQVGAVPGAAGAGAGAGSLVPSAIAAAAAAAGGNGQSGQWPPNGNAQAGGGWGNGNAGTADRADRGYGNRGRSRSRSPQYWEGSGDRSGRRGSPNGRGGGGDRGRGRDYRQRSPPGDHRNGGSNSPRQPPGPGEKWIEHDPTLPSGSIRVLSRTLFVGGVTIPEAELRAIFSRFGDVQTCIVNKEKRHAFVKMYTRKDAEAAKEGMEHMRHDDSGLRTRWGVGFGPRDCSDYAKGISVIPITKLTDADRKWLLTAPWGGSGGQPITPGLVVEEPDIEIGAGVSSKAISRRMQTDRGGINGPRSTRREEEIANANTIPINPHGPGAGRRGGRGNHSGGRGGYEERRSGGGAGDDLSYDNNSNNNNNNNNNGHNAAAAVLPFQFGAATNNLLFPQGGYTNYPAPE